MPRALPTVPALGRLIAAAAVVGALGATTAIAIRVALDRGIHALYGADDVVSGITAAPVWMRIVAPAIGGLAAGLIVQLLIRRRSQGVADVMEAVALGRGRPRLRIAAAQAAGSVVALVGGGSLGREGPLIQLGASVGHTVARRVTAVSLERRALVAAGTAAGFAAAYNTPLAAVLFVLEVVVGVTTIDVVIPVAVATAIGTAVTRTVVGGGPIYGLRAFEVVSPWEFLTFAAVGAIAAGAGAGFMKLLALGERGFARLRRWPRPARTALGGLLVGLMLWRLPEVAGNGYEPLRQTLDGQFALTTLLVLGVAKAVATTASVSSGSPGGVFTPTMLIGAALGAALGKALLLWAPFGAALDPGGYALVGMAATVAATTHAPLMATVLAFELSGDYPIVLPLLLATAVATLLARVLQRDSIYTAELRRRGIPWEGSIAERLARTVRARDLMEPVPITSVADEPLEIALAKLAAGRGRLLYVVGDGPPRAISLTVAKTLWAGAMRGTALPPAATAGDVAVPVVAVAPDDALPELGAKLWTVDWGELPVVDPAEPGRLLGIVTRRGLLGAFDRELLQRDVLTTRVMEPGDDGDHAAYLRLPDGHQVAVVAVPDWLVGKTADLAALRADLGIIVVAVQAARDARDNAPRWLDADAGLVLEVGDRLMVIATADELVRFADARPPAQDVTGPRPISE